MAVRTWLHDALEVPWITSPKAVRGSRALFRGKTPCTGRGPSRRTLARTRRRRKRTDAQKIMTLPPQGMQG
jgi:hypothetical protein